jgi:hypothetical protein
VWNSIVSAFFKCSSRVLRTSVRLSLCEFYVKYWSIGLVLPIILAPIFCPIPTTRFNWSPLSSFGDKICVTTSSTMNFAKNQHQNDKWTVYGIASSTVRRHTDGFMYHKGVKLRQYCVFVCLTNHLHGREGLAGLTTTYQKRTRTADTWVATFTTLHPYFRTQHKAWYSPMIYLLSSYLRPA